MKPTQEQVITWAREAGFEHIAEADYWHPLFERFAALAHEAGRKDENEACAKVCELIRYKGYVPPEDGAAASYYDDASIECADAIRARWKK